jgi:hypothetical protein
MLQMKGAAAAAALLNEIFSLKTISVPLVQVRLEGAQAVDIAAGQAG